MEQSNWEYFARCPGGLEGVLAAELKSLRLRQVRPLKGGVSFSGDAAAGYRACLWSRCATRVQLVLARVGARDAADLYEGVAAFPWEDHVRPGATVAVRASGANPALHDARFTALRVKDALCDRLLEKRGIRPDVDAHEPGFALDVALHRDRATVSLNLTGAPRSRQEVVAAALLEAAGWGGLCRRRDCGPLAFVDPLCGRGVLAVEAALVAADRAPGLARDRWGFEGWGGHDAGLWRHELERAEERARRARARFAAAAADEAAQIALAQADAAAGASADMLVAVPVPAAPGPSEPVPVRIVAGSPDRRDVKAARTAAAHAGVDALVEFHACSPEKLMERIAESPLPQAGLVAAELPAAEAAPAAHGGAAPDAARALARACMRLPRGWKVALVAGDPAVDTAFGLVPERVVDFQNGPSVQALRVYDADPAARHELHVVSLSGAERTVAVSEEGSAQFAARLRKVGRERRKWARRAGVACYRVYDADLPDYAVAVDVYGGAGPDAGQRYLRIAEYQAPASVDPQRAARRFADALAVAPAVLDVPEAHVFSKVRRHAKGGGQYREARSEPFVVYTEESGYRFEVDLDGRLDTGIFLDHRTTRELVGRLARGRRFLNLFAYTGTATVHAAGGGADSTMTVDLSQTYLDWARRNMAANGFDGRGHCFERADALWWLEREADWRGAYDLVFCDPPTFSNSNSRGARTFDVQRDHVELLDRIGDVLAPGGVVVFSCNLRRFKLDAPALAERGLLWEDITAQTIPHDFERNPKVHRCYLVALDEGALVEAKELVR